MSLFAEIFQRASFAEVVFPVTEMSQVGARQAAEHEVWRRDGAELVDGGRKAYRGKLTGAFFTTIEGYGNDLFPRRLEDLVRVCETQAEAVLAHPLLGTFRAMVTEWEPRLSSRWQNGAYLDLTWIEQRASVVGVVAVDLDRGNADPRAELAAQAATADTALAAAGVSPPAPLAAVAASSLAKVESPKSYGEVGKALTDVESASIEARNALRAVTVTASNALALYLARASVARVRTATRRLHAALLPDPSRTRLYTTPRAMTFAELSLAVYGTPMRAGDLRAANGIARDVIPPGRTLRVLP
jgi:prophage DNA circulation protein